MVIEMVMTCAPRGNRSKAIVFLPGLIVHHSSFYVNRYRCIFLGPRGEPIKSWIRTQFGDLDDLVYASSEPSDRERYDALITKEQLSWITLRWS